MFELNSLLPVSREPRTPRDFRAETEAVSSRLANGGLRASLTSLSGPVFPPRRTWLWGTWDTIFRQMAEKRPEGEPLLKMQNLRQ